MKKSLIALAVLAASGAAMAQSSVNIYGVADLWFGTATVKQDGVKLYPESQTGLYDGGVSNSRFGFKGSEDLGGGLKANFQLEQGFSIDDGKTETGTAFSRQAWLGLSGGFGEFQLGKAYNAFDDVSAMAASVFDSDLAPINNIFLTTGAADAFANTIKYSTPSLGGFSGAASYSFGENKDVGVSASKQYALSGSYNAGPLAVGVGYVKFDEPVAGADADAVRVAGSYDLDVATLKATYGRFKGNIDSDFGLIASAKANEWEIGADFPLASNLTLGVGYASANWKVSGVKVAKAKSFGAALAYSLSKRTTAYAGLNNTKFDVLAANTVVKGNVYAVGLKHTF